jgi:hypothetical protein
LTTVTFLFIKTRDYETRPPYIIENEEFFLREGETFLDQLITTKKLIDPLGRIEVLERNNRNLPTNDPEYRGISKGFFFGDKDDDFLFGIPTLMTNYEGYGGDFEVAEYDPKIAKDEVQDIEFFDREETIQRLRNYSQNIVDWFLNDEFLPPASF